MPIKINERDLKRRALSAYFKVPIDNGSRVQPSDPEIIEHDGRLYVRLSNVNGTLHVYRVLNHNGALRTMKRPPKEIAPDLYES